MIELHRDFHAARFVGDEGDQILHIRGASGRGKTAGDDILGIEFLDFRHAPDETLLKVHHLVGIGEIAWQPGIGAFELAGPFAKIAGLERDILRAALGRPQRLAAIDGQKTRVGHRVRNHRAIALDLLFRVGHRGLRQRRRYPRAERERRGGSAQKRFPHSFLPFLPGRFCATFCVLKIQTETLYIHKKRYNDMLHDGQASTCPSSRLRGGRKWQPHHWR